MMRDVVLRKAVCIDGWDPTPKQWDFLLSLQTPQDQELIEGFRFVADAKRSMLARLMLQSCAASCLGVNALMGCSVMQAKIDRTLEGRPFVSNTGRPGFNMNLSHHGSWVFLGSEERGVIGVDVMTTTVPRAGEDAETFFCDFEEQLTRWEWEQVRRTGPADANLYFAFFTFWALKESFIKAIGQGLGYRLQRLEFTVPPELLTPAGWAPALPSQPQPAGRLCTGQVQLTIDGKKRLDWAIELGVLGAAGERVPSHVLATAVGPHAEATPSLRETLGAVGERAGGVEEGYAGWREVECVAVEELLSGALRDQYLLLARPP